MLALSSSLAGSLSGLGLGLDPQHDTSLPSQNQWFTTATTSSEDDEDDEDTASIYHDVNDTDSNDDDEDFTREHDNDDVDSNESESCGGTIIASLSSKEVRQNITARLWVGVPPPQPDRKGPHPTSCHALTQQHPLSEVATVPSDALSFTPTMAEMAMSSRQEEVGEEVIRTRMVAATAKSTAQASSDDDGTSSLLFGIENLQPDRVACPFCDREKDLQWRLSREQEQSHLLIASAYRTRIIFVATVVSFVIAIVAFWLGKTISDRQAEQDLAHVVAQCHDMLSEKADSVTQCHAMLSQKAQKEEDELYWKLVSAAFTAMVNAAAGPVANFVIGGGNNHK